MKSIHSLLSLSFLFFLFSCSSENGSTASTFQNPSLLIMLYDISQSNDSYGILKEDHLEKIFDQMAFKGGGKFYAFHIKSNSLDQEAIEYVIPAFDTLQLARNPYQIKNRRKENQAILQSFVPVRRKFTTTVSQELIVPKTEGFTDLKNAVQLAKTTLEQKNYTNWSKHLLIISDGKNDLPPVNGVDPLPPIEISDVNVIMVRATTSDYISGSQPLLTNSINDGISNL